jgi:two-component system, cell cycle response regulator DivK
MAGEPILVVDDSPINRKLARLTLVDAGFDVRTAGDANDAETVLRDFHPCLILMDVRMPGEDGLSLTRRLKANPSTRDIIIVAVTAAASPEDHRAALLAGCEGCLPKPIDTATLARHLSGYVVRATLPPRPDLPTVPQWSSDDGALPPEAAQRLATIAERHGPVVLQEILHLFIATAEECLPGLRRAVAERDTSALQWLGHRLGGACYSFGARTAGAVCREIQTAEPSAPVTHALLERLTRELDGLRAGIVGLMGP